VLNGAIIIFCMARILVYYYLSPRFGAEGVGVVSCILVHGKIVGAFVGWLKVYQDDGIYKNNHHC